MISLPVLARSQETYEAKGVQGAKPPAGAWGVPALSLFPQRGAENALALDQGRKVGGK